MFKILQFSEMECNCVRKITEGLFRKYTTLWQHEWKSPITVLKILYTLAGDPLNFEALGFSPIAPIGKSGTGQPSFMYIDFVVRKSKNNKLNKYDDITYIFKGDYIKDGKHIVFTDMHC